MKMKSVFILLIVLCFEFSANAERMYYDGLTADDKQQAGIQYLKGENCEYTKNSKTRIVPNTLISISNNPNTKEINFFNVIDESGALLVGLSSHRYLSKFELAYPLDGRANRPFLLKYEDGIKYYGYTGSYVNRAMAIVFGKEDIKKIEYLLWDDSSQTDEMGGVTLSGEYRYKCESVSIAKPEFIRSVASSSFQFSIENAGYVHMSTPFSYTDHVKDLDFEDVYTIIYKVKGGWKDKTITKSYSFLGLSVPFAKGFDIKVSENKDNINFDKSLIFFDQTPEYVPQGSIETRFIFERKYKSSSHPSLKIEKKLQKFTTEQKKISNSRNYECK